jgi:hypothetical protein
MPTSTGRYNKDSAGWNRYALGHEIHDITLAVADRGRAWAESESPVDTGRFASSWETSSGVESYVGGPRAVAYLTNDTPYAAPVEFGSGPSVVNGVSRPGNQAQRVLSRTAEYLGYA